MPIFISYSFQPLEDTEGGTHPQDLCWIPDAAEISAAGAFWKGDWNWYILEQSGVSDRSFSDQHSPAMSTSREDEYITIQGESHAELKVQGSRFIAAAYPASGLEDIERTLDGLREKYHDATHHCFAYRLGPDRTRFRSSDDGEPSGTAGKPILAALDRESLTDTLVVVTRYFGGVKLGTGGLARAYGQAAKMALASAKRERGFILHRGILVLPHASAGHVMSTLSRSGAKIIRSTYGDDVRLEVEVRASAVDSMLSELRERTSGQIRIVREFGPHGAVP